MQNAIPGLSSLMRIWPRLKLVYRLLLDARVPIYLKLLPFAGLLYLISPLDFIPDVIPILGQMDDLGVIMLSMTMFVKMCPPYLVALHRQALGVPVDEPEEEDYVSNGTPAGANAARRRREATWNLW
jgi:uncharacterized membrane protein YkvA (DUF1232 family)